MSIAKGSMLVLVAAAATMPAAFSATRVSDADPVDIKPLPSGERICLLTDLIPMCRYRPE
jgi:hypothetical protein